MDFFCSGEWLRERATTSFGGDVGERLRLLLLRLFLRLSTGLRVVDRLECEEAELLLLYKRDRRWRRRPRRRLLTVELRLERLLPEEKEADDDDVDE